MAQRIWGHSMCILILLNWVYTSVMASLSSSLHWFKKTALFQSATIALSFLYLNYNPFRSFSVWNMKKGWLSTTSAVFLKFHFLHFNSVGDITKTMLPSFFPAILTTLYLTSRLKSLRSSYELFYQRKWISVHQRCSVPESHSGQSFYIPSQCFHAV